MAIIKCPQCAKSISDKQNICPHCDLDMSDLSEEKIESLSKIKSYKQAQGLMTHQFIAMLLFLAGCYSFWTIEDKTSPQYVAAQASILIGFIWYVVNRFRIIMAKRNRK